MSRDQSKLLVEALLCDIDRLVGKEELKNIKCLTNDYEAVTTFAKMAVAATERLDKVEDPDRDQKLLSVFNRLNGNAQTMVYNGRVLNIRSEIPYPQEPNDTDQTSFYKQVQKNILEFLKTMPDTAQGVNTLLHMFEANLSFIPAGAKDSELADISMYDYRKMVAAVAACTQVYMKDKNLETAWLSDTPKAKSEKMFLLYSMDVSGIQKFIYTVSSKGALRGLRARSFYLELVMEHIIDELLDKLELSRINLIYAGGGHCYMLLPNTKKVIQMLEKQEQEVNHWFLKHFGIALFVAGGCSEASVNSLANVPDGSYAGMYRNISKQIGHKKFCRYDAAVIQALNDDTQTGTRECEMCLKTDRVDENGRCPVCAALVEIGGNILRKKNLVVVEQPKGKMLPLPGRGYLTCADDTELAEWQREEQIIRCYAKNTFDTAYSKLWVGDYTTGDSFEELAEKSVGIKRLAVLRADVDNLGKTFVSGFQKADGDNRYVTLARTATLSRQLSLFFKLYINSLLRDGKENRLSGSKVRNISIVYSGGDDVFFAGAWNDVIEAAIDMKNALQKYSQGTLTISAGIGLYHAKYPVNIMAKETGRLEDCSKGLTGKDALTLFAEGESYHWTEFEEHVLGEKYKALCEFFEAVEDRGNNFLYHLLELLQNREERINKARYVYLLSRMEPDRNAEKEKILAYKAFSRKMYEWFSGAEDRKELITAILLYVYVKRNEEEK